MVNRLLTLLRREKNRPMQEATRVEQPPRPAPLDVTDEEFATIVLNADRLAVVDFWADWCAPCQIMSAYVAMLAETYHEQMVVAALDVDVNPATPERFAVLGLPTLIFFRHGVEIARIVGVVGFEELRQRVETLMGDGELVGAIGGPSGALCEHRERGEDAENAEDRSTG